MYGGMRTARHAHIVQDLVDMGDPASLELTLKLLENLCEGHNVELQNYLREQTDNIRTTDLVSLTVELLHVLIEGLDNHTMPLVVQAVDSLIEFVQGCVPNQLAVFDAKIIDALNFILRRHRYDKCPEYQARSVHVWVPAESRAGGPFKAKLRAADLVAAGGRQRRTVAQHGQGSGACAPIDQAPQQCVQFEVLDVLGVMKGLVYYFQAYKTVRSAAACGSGSECMQGKDRAWAAERINEDEDVPVARQVAFEYFHVLYRLSDFIAAPAFSKEAAAAVPEFQPIYDFYAARTQTIEMLRGDHLLRVHFFDKFSDQLREEDIESVKWNVDRSSPGDKISDFVARAKTIMADIDHTNRVEAWSPITKLTVRNTALWSRGACLCGCAGAHALQHCCC